MYHALEVLLALVKPCLLLPSTDRRTHAHGNTALHNALASLAIGWGGKGNNFSLLQCLSQNVALPVHGGQLEFEYLLDDVETNRKQKIVIPSLSELYSDVSSAFVDIVGQYNVPEASQFPLLCYIRTALSFSSLPQRIQAIKRQLIAFDVLIHSESGTVPNKILLKEPELGTELVDLIRVDLDSAQTGVQVPREIQILSIIGLIGLTSTRKASLSGSFRQSTILQALGAYPGVHHGIIHALARTSISSMGTSHSGPTLDELDSQLGVAFSEATSEAIGILPSPGFCRLSRWDDCLLTLLNYIASHRAGSSSLTDSGIVGALLSAIRNESVLGDPNRTITISLCVQLLDCLVENYSTAATLLNELNGMESILMRLCAEVSRAVAEYPPITHQISEGKENKQIERKYASPSHKTSSSSSSSSILTTKPRSLKEEARSIFSKIPFLPFPFRVLIKRLLQFFSLCLNLRSNSSQQAIGLPLGGMTGTAIPTLFNTLLQRRDIFGVPLLAITASLLAELLNGDPTSVTAVHNSGIASTFLELLQSEPTPVDSDFILAIPNTVRSLCLHTDVIEQIVKAEPLEPVFRVFLHPGYAYPFSQVISSENFMLVGSAIDELMRHFNAFREPCINGCIRVIEKLADRGEVLYKSRPDYLPGCSESSNPSDLNQDFTEWEQQYNILHQQILAIVSMVEQLIRSNTHQDLFLSKGGVSQLLKLAEHVLPTPGRFDSTFKSEGKVDARTDAWAHASQELIRIIQMLTHNRGAHTQQITEDLIESLKRSLTRLQSSRLAIHNNFLHLSGNSDIKRAEPFVGVLCAISDAPVMDALCQPDINLTLRFLRAIESVNWHIDILSPRFLRIMLLDTPDARQISRSRLDLISLISKQEQLLKLDLCYHFAEERMILERKNQRHTASTNSITLEEESKGETCQSRPTPESHQSRSKNAKISMKQVAIMCMARSCHSVAELLGNVSKLTFTSRSYVQPRQFSVPPNAHVLADTIAKIFTENLRLYKEGQVENKYAGFQNEMWSRFICQIASDIYNLIFGERKELVNVIIIHALQLADGIRDLFGAFNMCTKTWLCDEDKGKYLNLEYEKPAALEYMYGSLSVKFMADISNSGLHCCMVRLGELLENVASPQNIYKSEITQAHTETSGSSNRERNQFNPKKFLTDLHKDLEDVSTQLWEDDTAPKIPAEVLLSFLRISVDAKMLDKPQDAREDERYEGRPDPSRSRPFGGRRVVVDDMALQHLNQMGFSLSHAEQALTMHRNDIGAAMEWLLNQPIRQPEVEEGNLVEDEDAQLRLAMELSMSPQPEVEESNVEIQEVKEKVDEEPKKDQILLKGFTIAQRVPRTAPTIARLLLEYGQSRESEIVMSQTIQSLLPILFDAIDAQDRDERLPGLLHVFLLVLSQRPMIIEECGSVLADAIPHFCNLLESGFERIESEHLFFTRPDWLISHLHKSSIPLIPHLSLAQSELPCSKMCPPWLPALLLLLSLFIRSSIQSPSLTSILELLHSEFHVDKEKQEKAAHESKENLPEQACQKDKSGVMDTEMGSKEEINEFDQRDLVPLDVRTRILTCCTKMLHYKLKSDVIHALLSTIFELVISYNHAKQFINDGGPNLILAIPRCSSFKNQEAIIRVSLYIYFMIVFYLK